MAQFLANGATLSRGGITITGDGLGNQGILSVMRFIKIDRLAKVARVVCYWWVDDTHKDNYLNEPFDSLTFSIEGTDFDEYIVKEPQPDEDSMYLLMYKRAYDYISDKAALYNADPDDPTNADYAMFKDIVDDPQYA